MKRRYTHLLRMHIKHMFKCGKFRDNSSSNISHSKNSFQLGQHKTSSSATQRQYSVKQGPKERSNKAIDKWSKEKGKVCPTSKNNYEKLHKHLFLLYWKIKHNEIDIKMGSYREVIKKSCILKCGPYLLECSWLSHTNVCNIDRIGERINH